VISYVDIKSILNPPESKTRIAGFEQSVAQSLGRLRLDLVYPKSITLWGDDFNMFLTIGRNIGQYTQFLDKFFSKNDEKQAEMCGVWSYHREVSVNDNWDLPCYGRHFEEMTNKK